MILAFYGNIIEFTALLILIAAYYTYVELRYRGWSR